MRMRDRIRAGLADFEILADDLPSNDRDLIFESNTTSEEYRELEQDVSKAIEFLYTGMGGEANFREPLKRGVVRGELQLGNIEHPFDLEPRFALESNSRSDRREAVDAIENEEWDRLYPRDLFGFIKIAKSAGAIDFSKVHDEIDGREATRREAERLAQERQEENGG